MRRVVLLATRHREQVLQNLVHGEGKPELGRGSHDTSGAALEEGLEALLLVDGLCAVGERGVCGVALAGLDLEARLDDVAGGGEVGGWHAGDGAGCEELEDAELLGGGLAEVVALEVVVGWEVDGGEGDVAEETRGCALVETHQSEVLDDPHR